MGIYIQKKFQTAPVQAVTEPSLESNSPTNVPTIEAVNKGLSARQLLINNDFQINQRGQSEYTTKGYSLDMWLLAGEPFNGSLKINDNGTITITNKSTANMYLSQKMNLQGKHIAVVKVVNKSGNCTQYFGGTNLSKELNVGVNSFGINQNFTEVGIRLGTNSSITVEYIDLFEGDIAYPHVKKKYNDDLIECRKYLRKVYVKYIVRFNATNRFECFDTNAAKGMIAIPTIIKDNLTNITLYYKANFESIQKNTLNITLSDDTLQFGATISNNKTVDNCGTLWSQGYLLLSCEPL